MSHRKGLHFTLLPASVTGIDFAKSIPARDPHANPGGAADNPRNSTGGGVGVGDFNRDGLPDLFFAGDEVSSRLYLNKGDFHFEDITAKAGLSTDGRCTGVSVIDINNDGWPDIYVCVSGNGPGAQRRNLLFVNQHDLTFKEEAAEYGLADTSWSTQAVFFDYDHDGLPDLYLVNQILPDKLFHNEGIPRGMTHPVFKDVSRQAGIVENGSLAGIAGSARVTSMAGNASQAGIVESSNGRHAVIEDFNGDGYADIYVGSDNEDLLWLNNGDGTFTNVAATALRRQTYSTRGADAADINNDGLPDILSLGGKQRYSHPMLQLNNGTRPGPATAYERSPAIDPPAAPRLPNLANRPAVPEIPFFSEIGYMAGLTGTDFPRSALIADFDNDSWKDILIGSHLYRNKGGLLFEDISEDVGIEQPGISTGGVYVDLDNDGDLDLVTNNAFIYRNDAGSNHYLTIVLSGDSGNRDAIGATVYAFNRDRLQTISEYHIRGYLSSVDSRLHFGFGKGGVDSLRIVWPNGREQSILHPPIDTILDISYRQKTTEDPPADPKPAPLFVDATRQLGTAFQHKETFFFDYQFQPLILQKYSQEGPFISTGDLNGDGLEDFFIGGAFKQSGRLFFQNKDGSFTGRDLVTGNKYEEDMQSIIFDADGDSHPDLLVVSGSSEFDDRSDFYRPRLYLNDGKGILRLDSMAFSPDIRTPAKAVAVTDIDGDGQPDIFIGGRVSLGIYPRSCSSYILHNDHGRFVDVTARVCPALSDAGMLNAAVFTDLDGDGRPDLVLAGDGLPIRLFHNTGTTLQEITVGSGLQELPGFWRSLLVTDVNHDGYPDIVAGNLGLNNPFDISSSHPLKLPGIAKAGLPDSDETEPPQSGMTASPASDNAGSRASDKAGGIALEVKEARSGYFENDGHGHFSFHPFPLMAQIAPLNAIVCTDVDGDGYPDLILAGNEYQAAPLSGRYDASYGLLLRGDGHGGFQAVSPAVDGLILDGDVKDLKLIRVGGHKVLLTAINDQPMRALRLATP